MKEILKKIQNQKMTISQWMCGFMGIVFIRFILETLSSPTKSGIIPSDIYTLIHYALFWITLTLGLIIIVGYITKEYTTVSKLALFGLPIIWTAPLLDIVISRGVGFTQSYLFDSGKKLIIDFFTFFGPNLENGITYGIRIEMAFVLCAIGWYLWNTKKNFLQTIFGIFCVYTFGFIILSLPGIIYTFSHVNNSVATQTEILNYFSKLISNSNIAHNTLRNGALYMDAVEFIELCFDKMMSQILFIMSCFFTGILLWKIELKKFLAVMQNSRPERIGSYLSLLLCGMGFAYIHQFGNPPVWLDLFGFICLLISWISLWMHAVHINDISDISIDKISNPNRPLIKKDLNINDMQETGYVWLTIALIGASSAGFYPFIMSLIYIASYYIYSAPPLRLRRFPVIPSFLIGVAGLSTILTGFFFVSTNKQILTFPIFLSIGIVLMILLAINVKDMKDIEGDRKNRIMTIPVMFGKNGPKIVGLCFALSFLLVPIFLSFYFLYIVAIPVAIIGYKMVLKKPYREEPIFVLRFIFLACVGVLYLGVYWLGYKYNVI